MEYTGPRTSGPCFFSQFEQKLCLLQNLVWIQKFNKGGPTIELLSVWGMRVQAESLLIMHPVKRRVKESVDRFCKPLTSVRIHTGYLYTLTPVRVRTGYLHTPDTGQDTYGAPVHS